MVSKTDPLGVWLAKPLVNPNPVFIYTTSLVTVTPSLPRRQRFKTQSLKRHAGMAAEADDVASLVLEEFSKLPAKRKPAVRDNGLREWVPLSGIVVKGTSKA